MQRTTRLSRSTAPRSRPDRLADAQAGAVQQLDERAVAERRAGPCPRRPRRAARPRRARASAAGCAPARRGRARRPGSRSRAPISSWWRKKERAAAVRRASVAGRGRPRGRRRGSARSSSVVAVAGGRPSHSASAAGRGGTPRPSAARAAPRAGRGTTRRRDRARPRSLSSAPRRGRLPYDRPMPEEREGWVDVDGFRTWYRAVGDLSGRARRCSACTAAPAPRATTSRELEALADERAVVRYDQLGCGRSERAEGAQWTLDLFRAEVDAVRAELGLDRVHLVGTSWGGMLALEHALARPGTLAGLVLSSTLASASSGRARCGSSATRCRRRWSLSTTRPTRPALGGP